MVHVGIDVHQKTSYLYALDDRTGEVLLDGAIASEAEALRACLVPLQARGDVRLILEACGLAGYWSDVLDPLGEVIAVHPKKVRERNPDRRGDRRLAAVSHRGGAGVLCGAGA